MARKSPERLAFPKKRPAAKGLFATHGDKIKKPSSKALAVLRDAKANEAYHRDLTAKNG